MFSDPVEIKKAAEYEKMSEADRLFLDAGYEKMHDQKYKYDNAGLEVDIEFNPRAKSVMIRMYDKDEKKEYPAEITTQELKAINVKVKELRME